MLPNKTLGLLAFVIYAAGVVALTWMLFSSPAAAASREGRLYRGYANLCIDGVPLRCGRVQTIDVFDTQEACAASLADALQAYQRKLNLPVFAEVSCAFDPNLYEA